MAKRLFLIAALGVALVACSPASSGGRPATETLSPIESVPAESAPVESAPVESVPAGSASPSP